MRELSPQVYDQIHQMRENGQLVKDIANDLGVSKSTVTRVTVEGCREREKARRTTDRGREVSRLAAAKRREDPGYRQKLAQQEKERRQDSGYSSTVRANERKRYATRTHKTVSYLISCPALNKVKIGQTKDITKRLATLQCGNPEELTLLGVCDHNEAELHVRFADEHVIRERFHFSPRIRNFIETECRETP